jgi:hypothetical protein
MLWFLVVRVPLHNVQGLSDTITEANVVQRVASVRWHLAACAEHTHKYTLQILFMNYKKLRGSKSRSVHVGDFRGMRCSSPFKDTTLFITPQLGPTHPKCSRFLSPENTTAGV